jgi:hypothetical protein
MKTNTVEEVKALERRLTAYYKQSKNQVLGGGGNEGPGRQYVYILLRYKPSRSRPHWNLIWRNYIWF